MATKKCPNGHQYDSSIYGDNCPFCPSGASEGASSHEPTRVNPVGFGISAEEKPTVPVVNKVTPSPVNDNGGRTVIRPANNDANDSTCEGRKMVAVLVSRSINPLGEVFKIYEGRNIIGRGTSCDITIPNDNHVSTEHLLILYREADGIFWADDMNSSNGTYVNGTFVSEKVKLQSGDIIVIGGTKFAFMAVPQL